MQLKGSMPNFTSAPSFRLVVVGALTLALQIPILLINAIAWERDRTRDQAVREIADSWGHSQEIVGPFLVIPYRYEQLQVDDKGVETVRTVTLHGTFLPSRVNIQGGLEVESRHRGIFESPVYTTDLAITGAFDKPDVSDWVIEEENLRWEAAEIVFEIADARAIQNAAQLEWGGRSIGFEPGLGKRQAPRPGIHALIGEAFGRRDRVLAQPQP